MGSELGELEGCRGNESGAGKGMECELRDKSSSRGLAEASWCAKIFTERLEERGAHNLLNVQLLNDAAALCSTEDKRVFIQTKLIYTPAAQRISE